MERLMVDEMRILREEDGKGCGHSNGASITALSHTHKPVPLPSFSSLTIRLPRKPHIVAISVQCPRVSAFLSCSCLIDTLATHKTCFPDF
jgi:hypothetical protein